MIKFPKTELSSCHNIAQDPTVVLVIMKKDHTLYIDRLQGVEVAHLVINLTSCDFLLY